MFCLCSTSHDPCFNLATEEFLLKNKDENCFFIYINEPSVIIGKHQNTLAEINLDFVRKEKIKVVRRLSGGGTVYHDLGNVNFSFITKGEVGYLVNFRKFTQPIIEVLQKLGIEAKLGGRNDILVEGKKISGNAEHLFKTKVLHHGTLLFSSRLDHLTGVLKIDPLKYSDHAVKSVRSEVTNIQDYLKEPLAIEGFSSKLFHHILGLSDQAYEGVLSADEKMKIQDLARSKYASREWNFGYSPGYSLERTIKTQEDPVQIKLEVDNGKISSIKILSAGIKIKEINELEQKLRGVDHDPDALKTVLTGFPIEKYFQSISLNQFIDGLF